MNVDKGLFFIYDSIGLPFETIFLELKKVAELLNSNGGKMKKFNNYFIFTGDITKADLIGQDIELILDDIMYVAFNDPEYVSKISPNVGGNLDKFLEMIDPKKAHRFYHDFIPQWGHSCRQWGLRIYKWNKFDQDERGFKVAKMLGLLIDGRPTKLSDVWLNKKRC